MALLTLIAVSICSAFVVTHAAGSSVAEWLLQDALNKDMLDEENFSFTAISESPALSDNRFHLQMPMTMEEYVNEDIYAATPDALSLTLEDGFYDDAYVPYSEDEWNEGGDNATEFIFNRPPDSPLG
jgi:hypothetical protein